MASECNPCAIVSAEEGAIQRESQKGAANTALIALALMPQGLRHPSSANYRQCGGLFLLKVNGVTSEKVKKNASRFAVPARAWALAGTQHTGLAPSLGFRLKDCRNSVLCGLPALSGITKESALTFDCTPRQIGTCGLAAGYDIRNLHPARSWSVIKAVGGVVL